MQMVQTVDTSKAVKIEHDFDLNETVTHKLHYCVDMNKNPITTFYVLVKENSYVSVLYKGYCNSWVIDEDIPINHYILK